MLANAAVLYEVNKPLVVEDGRRRRAAKRAHDTRRAIAYGSPQEAPT